METFDFNREVIDSSGEVPVVVDFWAPWCGPCRYLEPVIEELADEAGGRWKLVKINADEHPDLMMQYGVRGIPTIKLFINGKVIAGFSGALPKTMVVKWLEGNLPDERKMHLAFIRQNLHSGERFEALLELEAFVNENPDIIEARLILAKEKVLDDPSFARKLVMKIKEGNPYYQFARDIRTIAELMDCDEDEPYAVSQKIKAAQIAIDDKNLDAALKYLVEAMAMDKTFQNELPRRSCISIFHILGENHELTRKYRRMFGMALY